MLTEDFYLLHCILFIRLWTHAMNKCVRLSMKTNAGNVKFLAIDSL